MVSVPSLSSVQVRLLPSPSAPQVPLAATSAANAVAGRSDAIISTASTKLKSRFLICSILSFAVVFAYVRLPCIPKLPTILCACHCTNFCFKK